MKAFRILIIIACCVFFLSMLAFVIFAGTQISPELSRFVGDFITYSLFGSCTLGAVGILGKNILELKEK